MIVIDDRPTRRPRVLPSTSPRPRFRNTPTYACTTHRMRVAGGEKSRRLLEAHSNFRAHRNPMPLLVASSGSGKR